MDRGYRNKKLVQHPSNMSIMLNYNIRVCAVVIICASDKHTDKKNPLQQNINVE